MTDEQFERFLEAFERKMDDHDLLTEIKTIVKLNHESFCTFRDDTTEKISSFSKQVSSAHRRIDWITVGGFISVVTVIISLGAFYISMVKAAPGGGG